MNKYAYKRRTIETVDVPVPSGNVFKMQKPSKYQVLFQVQSLPASLTEKAITSWQEQGVGSDVEEAVVGVPQEDRLKLMQLSFKIRDAVLKLSVEPKIVMGEAENDKQLSVDDIEDADLDFLFKWVASGGSAAAGVADFRKRPAKDAVDQSDGAAFRTDTVKSRGAKVG